jgi:hypothetical protein
MVSLGTSFIDPEHHNISGTLRLVSALKTSVFKVQGDPGWA